MPTTSKSSWRAWTRVSKWWAERHERRERRFLAACLRDVGTVDEKWWQERIKFGRDREDHEG